MIINRNYIDSNFEFLSLGYSEIVVKSLNYISITGYGNIDMQQDLISLDHYLNMMREYAKYYASLIDEVYNYNFVALVAEDLGILKYLVSDDSYILYALSPGYEYSTENTIVNQYVRLGSSLVKDVTINTNMITSGFLTEHNIDIDSVVTLQDTSIQNHSSLNLDKTNSFIRAVMNANEIVYKYSTSRYTSRF